MVGNEHLFGGTRRLVGMKGLVAGERERGGKEGERGEKRRVEKEREEKKEVEIEGRDGERRKLGKECQR